MTSERNPEDALFNLLNRIKGREVDNDVAALELKCLDLLVKIKVADVGRKDDAEGREAERQVEEARRAARSGE